MALDLFRRQGCPLEKQNLSWKEIVNEPISKLDDDAFTRIRVLLMNAIKMESISFSRACSYLTPELKIPLAQIRQLDQQQAVVIHWLLSADHNLLETTIAYEQMEIEVTAAAAQSETDPYLDQVFRFSLLEDFEHLYRFSALMDRLEGKDANNILQSYTDILPGRPTAESQRPAAEHLFRPYDCSKATTLTKINCLTLLATQMQTSQFYLNTGPQFSDPLARLLYAEIGAIEEQHATQYQSILDTDESLLEKWVLHKATEVYNFYRCAEFESNPRIKSLWNQLLDFQMGQLHFISGIFEKHEKRDVLEILPDDIQAPVEFNKQREFIRGLLSEEIHLRVHRGEFIRLEDESADTKEYRKKLQLHGSPSEIAALDYIWIPGGELNHRKDPFLHLSSGKGEKGYIHEEHGPFRIE